MKKNYSFEWATILIVRSLKIFRIIILVIFCVMVTGIKVFGEGPFKDDNLKKAISVNEIMIPVQIRVTGSIKDESGTPMPGVNIQVEGTTIGAISDANGRYSIEVQNANSVIVFSFIGYVSQRVIVGNRAVIDVSLVEELKALDEVVVVGYGTQRKVNLTGAISTTNADALDSKIVSKASLALVGEVSGISIRQASGNPNENSGTLRIRGMGTFSTAGNNPLVLVDGIESSLDNVDPNNIENVSVLKDAASAAIYGSKAANGVILVTTKKGKAGITRFSYYSYVGKLKATMLPEMCDSWTYCEAYNEALQNAGQSTRFTAEDIAKYKAGTDPNYPNFDHMKYLWESGKGITQKHGISMTGGSEATQYLFSVSALKEDGLIKKNYVDEYNAMLNLSSNLTDKLRLTVSLSGKKYLGNEPAGAYSVEGFDVLTRGTLRMHNKIAGITPDGYYGNLETIHPEADLNNDNFMQDKSLYLYGTTGLEWEIIKGLKISGKFGYTDYSAEKKRFRAKYYVNPTYLVSPNYLHNNWSNSTGVTVQSLINYDKSFGDHSINLLGGFEQKEDNYKAVYAYRDNFPTNALPQVSVGSVTNDDNSGSASRSKLRSFFGRANYAYQGKYLFEANVRYDGSSRFPVDSRWGVFPSFSAGWRISQEDFFKNAVSWIDDLKLRGSWGELGNQSVGNYPYQNLISLSPVMPFGTALAPGAAVLTLPNKEITWETTAVTDLGLDLSVLQGKLALTADWYKKITHDILYSLTNSYMLGAGTGAVNAGKIGNKGWEFELSYRNSHGDFSYRVSGNISINHNEVLELAGVEKDISRGLFIGEPIGSVYAYVADGLFVDAADVASYATQTTYTAAPGDIRFKDLSGPDGVPDGKVDATYDRSVIGQPIPITVYGLTLSANYKGFSLDALFQGEGGRTGNCLNQWHWLPFDNDGNIQQWMYDQRWTTANPDRNAKFPRLQIGGSALANLVQSSYWERDATFIRLKNLQLGYNLPAKIANKLLLDKLRIYINGENLFTITDYFPNWDPEMVLSTSYGWYPLIRTWSMGINIDF